MSVEWCKNYRGMYGPGGVVVDTCKAGVAYASVKDETQKPFQYPCFQDDHPKTTCALQQFPTPAEVAAHEAKVRASFDAYMNNIKRHVCPICKKPIIRYQKVGRCVYVDPCGDRLWQGGLTAEMKAHNDARHVVG
jgi:hypothetical protein